MTRMEYLLYRALKEVWPTCAVCSAAAEYRPVCGGKREWFCESHLPAEATLLAVGSRYERAFGFEALTEMESALAYFPPEDRFR